MKNSLQDQLLKAGLIDEKEVKSHHKAKRKQAKQQKHSKAPQIDETKEQLKAAQREKVERDRALNKAREDEKRKKEAIAQIKQIIEHTKLERDGGEIPFNFTHGSQVKKIYVTEQLQKYLSAGKLCIVESEESYEIVRADVAEKLTLRDPDYFIYMPEDKHEEFDEDDPYAKFVVPDDLVW